MNWEPYNVGKTLICYKTIHFTIAIWDLKFSFDAFGIPFLTHDFIINYL